MPCLMVIATLRCDDVAGVVFGDGDGYVIVMAFGLVMYPYLPRCAVGVE